MQTTATPVTTAAPADDPQRQNADTYGWNTTFAINFTNANQAIMVNWQQVDDKVKNLDVTSTDDPSYNIKATFDPWQLTVGGDGKNIRMNCPIASGTYNAATKSYSLANVQVIIEIGMEWVPNPDQFAFVVANTSEVNSIAADLDRSRIDADLTREFAAHGVTLSSAADVTVQQPGKEWLITDGKTNYYLFYLQDKDNDAFLNVYQFDDAWKNNLKILAQEVNADQPAVTIITIKNDPATGIPASVLPELLSVWFNANIGSFNYVFAALDLSPLVASGEQWTWMKPTSTSYAVIDQGTMDSSIFGVLTMVSNNPAASNHQVSDFAIPTGKDANGAQAGFLISGPQFMLNMMLSGAREIFNGAPLSSFRIDNDGLTITNTEALVWGKFQKDDLGGVPNQNFTGDLDRGTIPAGLRVELQGISIFLGQSYRAQVTEAGSQWLLTTGSDSDPEYILELTGPTLEVYSTTIVNIDKGHFKMSLVNSYVEIEFIDLNYSYSSSFDVHVNYTEQVELGLNPDALKAGKNVFWYTQTLQNMTVNVTKTQAAITREIVEGAVTAVLSLVAIAGPIFEGLSEGAEITGVTEEEGSALIDSEAFTTVDEENPAAAEENELDAADNAAGQSSGRITRIKNAFNTPKWKFVGALAGISGAIAGIDTTVSAIIENAAKNEWQNVPGFDAFANLAIAPYQWPNVDKFTLVSAWLAGSLQLGLKVDTTKA